MKFDACIISRALLSGFFLLLMQPVASRTNYPMIDQPLPEFSQTGQEQWLNSAPLFLEVLRGRVVVIEFWTSECPRCFRTVAWMKSLQRRFADRPVTIIGVHTPEFDHERRIENVAAKVEEFELAFPIMVDNDYAYWSAIKNAVWPAIYIVDKTGILRHVYYGVKQVGDSQSRRMATMISRLAKQPHPDTNRQ